MSAGVIYIYIYIYKEELGMIKIEIIEEASYKSPGVLNVI